MNKKEFVLAALSASDHEASYTPVQLQKLFFLIDKNLEGEFEGCPFFNFQPYHYGPFDKEVYRYTNELEIDGLIETFKRDNSYVKNYKLTSEGFDHGRKLLDNLNHEVKDYVENLNAFVRRLSFSELISSIYKSYPSMKVNSIFQENAG